MKSEGDDKTRNQRASGRQARAMTRAIDMVSEEFIESFSQTGKDNGPETPHKPSPVREALAARERREEEEIRQAEAKPAFKGFGALLAGASGTDNETVAAEPAHTESDETHAGPGVQTNADGSVIKRKDTSGKQRGLYTSWMQKPTAEQIQDAAVKYSRPEARAQAAHVPTPEIPEEPASTPTAAPEPTQNTISPFSRQAAQQVTPQTAPPKSPMASAAPSPISRPAPTRTHIQPESSCPIACAFGEFGLTCRRLFGWVKSIFEK